MINDLSYPFNITSNTMSKIVASTPGAYHKSGNWKPADAVLSSPSFLSLDLEGTGLVQSASKDLDLDLAASWDTGLSVDYTVAANRSGKWFFVVAYEDPSEDVSYRVTDSETAFNYVTPFRFIETFRCLNSTGFTIQETFVAADEGDIDPTSINSIAGSDVKFTAGPTTPVESNEYTFFFNTYEQILYFNDGNKWEPVTKNSTVSKEIGEIFFSSNPEEEPGCKFLSYEGLSQSTYASLFSKIGHMYAKTAADAVAAENASSFFIPDGTFLFARGGRSWTITDADIDTTLFRITVTGHGLAVDGSDDGRPIKLQRKPGEFPTLPSALNYFEYDQSYIRVIDANTIELYTTEFDAIDAAGSGTATTNRLQWSDAGSGDFMLTTMGCYQGWAVAPVGLGSTVGTDETFQSSVADGENVNGPDIQATGGAATGPQVVLRDGNGSNETRPEYVSLGLQIKVSEISAITGMPMDMMVWDSNWQTLPALSTKTTVTHNLGLPLEDLIIEIWVKDISSGSIQRPEMIYSGGDHGAYLEALDDNSISFIMGNLAVRMVSDTGIGYDLTHGTDQYQLKVYRPEYFTLPVRAESTYQGMWTTGWVPNSDWTNATLNVNHGLGKNITDLQFDVYMSPDGTDENAVKVETISSTGSATIGVSYYNIDENTLAIQTGSNGISWSTLNTGGQTYLAGTNLYYYKVVIYEPNYENVVPISSVSYEHDTGWIDPPSGWGLPNAIAHGLNADLNNLIVQVYFKCDQYDETEQPGGFTSTGYGARVKTTGDMNNLVVEFAANGPRVYDDGGSFVAIGSVTTPKMRVKIRKVNIITENTKPVSGADQVMSSSITVQVDEYTDELYIEMIGMTEGNILTLERTGTPGPRNKVRVFNGSGNRQNVYDSVNDVTYWLEDGQETLFYFRGASLKWGSPGWELVWTGSQQQVGDSSLLRGKPNNSEKYSLQLYYTAGNSYYTVEFYIQDNAATINTSPDYVNGTYCSYEGVNDYFDSNSANYPIQRIKQWHNGGE